MDRQQWAKFRALVIPGCRVRCRTGKKLWLQTWREGVHPRDYPCFGGPEGEKYEGILWTFSEYDGPKKYDDEETVIVNVHPFNNWDLNNKGLIHPHIEEVEYCIADVWLTFNQVMALPWRA